MLESSHIEIDGARIHFVSGGHGKTILFVHGFSEFWFAWRPQLAYFARSHRVIAVDLPGCNLSQPLDSTADYAWPAVADRIAALIRQLSPAQPVAVVGHDFGGTLAWDLAARHPALVERLVVLNGPPAAILARQIEHDPAQRAASAHRELLATPGIEPALAADGYAALAARLFDSAAGASAFSDADRHAYRAAWSRPGAVGGMLGYYRAWPRVVTAPARVEAPALVIWGEDDPFLLIGCLDGIEAMAREVEVLRVPGASHWVARERAAEVNAHIARFLAPRAAAIDFTRLALTPDFAAASAESGHGRILGRGDPEAGGWPAPSIEPGRAALTMRIDAAHSGVLGIAHGGLMFAVLDELMAWLVLAHVGRPGVTASASVEYLAPLRAGAEYIFEATPALGATSTRDRIALTACISPVDAPDRSLVRMNAVFAVPSPAQVDAVRANAPAAVPAAAAGPVRRSNRLDFEIVDFTAEHIAAAAAMMARSFAAYDPLTRAAGIREDEMYPYSLDIAEKAARDGISLVGLDHGGRVIACVISERSDDFIVPTRPLSAKFDAVFALVDELHRPFLEHEHQRYPPGSIVHCTDLAVAVDVVGRGVGTRMNQVNAIHLRERGYRWAYSEYSNEHNYRSMEKYAHRVLAKIEIPRFEYQGRRPFAAATGHAIATFVALQDPALVQAQPDHSLATS